MKNQPYFVFLLLIFTLKVNTCPLSTDNKQADLSFRYQSTNASCTEDCCASLSQNSNRDATTYYYYQNTGKLKGGYGQWAIDTMAYSGQGQGYLNPDYQCKKGGPLPASTYIVAFCKNVMHESTNRPCSFYL